MAEFSRISGRIALLRLVVAHWLLSLPVWFLITVPIMVVGLGIGALVVSILRSLADAVTAV
jgi:hypothetical protein